MAPDPLNGSDVVTIDDIACRYRIGRTRAYELVKERWFPRPILDSPRRWTLSSIVAAEMRRAS